MNITSSSSSCVAFLQFFVLFSLPFSGNTTCLPPAVAAIPSVMSRKRQSGAASRGIAGEAAARDLSLTTLESMNSFSWQFRRPLYSMPWPCCSTPSMPTAKRRNVGDARPSAAWEPVQPIYHLSTVVTSCNCNIKYLFHFAYTPWEVLTA